MNRLGNLSQCMVDGDGGETGHARRLRWEALFASLFLQGAVILALLLWPLITLGVLPMQLVFTPLPPFRGARNSVAPARETTRPALTRRIIISKLLRQPPVIPPHVPWPGNAQPVDVNEIGDPIGEEGSQLWIAGATDSGSMPNIARPDGGTLKNGPRTMSSAVMSALLIHRVEPEYPAMAKFMRLSGTVQLRATIGVDGNVENLEVISGNPVLAEAALAAVRNWRYRPTRLNGTAVEVETEITVNFILQ